MSNFMYPDKYKNNTLYAQNIILISKNNIKMYTIN